MTGATSNDAEERVALIYEQYASRIAAYAVRRTTGPDAADAVAETFLIAWRRHDDVPEEPKTLPWLYGVTRRVLANQHRTRRRRGRLADRLTSEFVTQDVGQPPLEEIEEFRRVARALNELSPDDAELLRLTAWEGLTPREIATVLDVSPGTTRQRLSRARQRLRQQLDLEDAANASPAAGRPGHPNRPGPSRPSAGPRSHNRTNDHRVLRTIQGGVAP